MREVSRISAGLARSAWGRFSGAKERLREPQCEPLFPDAAAAMQQQRPWHGAALGRIAESTAQRVVADER